MTCDFHCISYLFYFVNYDYICLCLADSIPIKVGKSYGIEIWNKSLLTYSSHKMLRARNVNLHCEQEKNNGLLNASQFSQTIQHWCIKLLNWNSEDSVSPGGRLFWKHILHEKGGNQTRWDYRLNVMNVIIFMNVIHYI